MTFSEWNFQIIQIVTIRSVVSYRFVISIQYTVVFLLEKKNCRRKS